MKHMCPVCGEYEFEEEASFDICLVCGWEDDDFQAKYPDEDGGANILSLNEAKTEWNLRMHEREKLITKLNSISFFQENVHPEYLPFLGKQFDEYRILQVGESHFIDNGPGGQEKYPINRITLADYDGWWDGKESQDLKQMSAWYTTDRIVNSYFHGEITRSHGIFTNFGNAFVKGVKGFESSAEYAASMYKYFAFMNFYQMPSIYRGMNFTKALYNSGKNVSGFSEEEIDKIWYECWAHSVEVFEAVVEALAPKLIVITSSEIGKYYYRYGQRKPDGKNEPYVDKYGTPFWPGKLCGDNRLLVVDHPGSAWWNRKKNGKETSRKILENKFREIYQ